MDISLYLMLALLVALAVWWWFQRKPTSQAVSSVPEDRHHHGVMIVPGPHPCSAVTELRGHRLLAQEAPLLPLPSCTSGQCQCTYRHLSDRRQLKERRHTNVDIDKHHKLHEKRSGRDRRHYSLR